MSRRLIIYYLLAVGMVVAWFMTAYRPMQQKQSEARTHQAELESRLDDYQRTAADLPRLLERHKELERSKVLLESKLFAKADLLELFEKLEGEARMAGLSLYDITPPVEELIRLNARSRNSAEPLFLNLSVVLDGRFIEFARYLRAIENEPFFRGVNGCSIRAGKNPGDDIRCTIRFKALLGSPTEAA
ncbi:hypothetical protein GF420_04315 [candidate division GN15 bacterium]|nr:hypothetical protein [candidate division GN15 bacterium]